MVYLNLMIIVGCYVVMAGWLLIAMRYGEYIESFFPKSESVFHNASFYEKAGVIGKVMRVVDIAMVLTLRTLFSKKELFHAEEFLAFPVRWRWLLVGWLVAHFIIFGLLLFAP